MLHLFGRLGNPYCKPLKKNQLPQGPKLHVINLVRLPMSSLPERGCFRVRDFGLGSEEVYLLDASLRWRLFGILDCVLPGGFFMDILP